MTFKRATIESRRRRFYLFFSRSLFETIVGSEVFASCNTRESPREGKQDILFSRMNDRLCVSFSHSPGRTRLLRARTPWLLVPYIHREIDFKESRDDVEGPSFSTPRGSRDAGACAYTRCPKRCVPSNAPKIFRLFLWIYSYFSHSIGAGCIFAFYIFEIDNKSRILNDRFEWQMKDMI